ncbi:MAG: type I-E CRISPR-associated protein Cas6/Cse3/CasE [Thermomicrobiales bacterium]
MSGDALTMLRLGFDGPRLIELARRRRLPARDVDLGYVVHCALGELFGAEAPKPFAITREQGRVVEVLAYSPHTRDALHTTAQTFADPSLYDGLCHWASFAGKPMPEHFTAGQRLGFMVKVCPTVRPAKPGLHQESEAPEVDAFLAACRKVGPEVKVDRETVYREWFLGEIARRGGATVEHVALERFQLERLTRRHQGADRKSESRDRPAASFHGTLTVTDPALFRATLARGLGRHRAFGFGMLLLRPLAPR